ncbi:MAG: peptidase M14 [Candidimonas sp.]|nr:MAG: peptidase M14 [Candidimonas sp.]
MENVQDRLARAAAGTRQHGKIPVGFYASGAEIALPYILVKGAQRGPCLWVNGQVHGDELNGVMAAIDFANGLRPETMSGSVVVTPTANPMALDSRRKRTPQDDQDIDQTFPGNAYGFLSDRASHALFEQIHPVANCLVSLHTMNPLFQAKPYAVYKVRQGGKVTEDHLLKCTSFFQPSVSCRMDVGGAGELPGNIAGAIDYQCLLKGIPAFMIELGKGSYIEPENVALAVNGLTRLAAFLGILPGDAPPFSEVRRVTRRSWVNCGAGGLFRSEYRGGDTVKAGTAIGIVMDLTGREQETVVLDTDCIIIGVRRDPVVHTGDRVAFVAKEWSGYTVA